MVNNNFIVDDKLSPEQVKLNELVKHLLIVLSEKERYIIENRFALNDSKRQTLEQIGNHFGVTRERIRQIEKGALRKLERSAQNTNIRILTEFAKALLEKEGGIAQDQYFKEMLMKILPNVTENELHELHLALSVDPDINFQSNTLKYHPYWHLKSVKSDVIRQTGVAAIKTLKKAKQVLDFKSLANKIQDQNSTALSDTALINIVRISKDCKFTEEGVGLYSWRHIHPRTLRDKINYIFKKEKKPLHFSKISRSIESANFDNKTVNIQAVHNELIRNDDFILIGRGIYALKEWGFESGTVADIIEKILSDGVARSRSEITKAVLEQRQVKSITIYLNLKNKEQFVRVGRDKYTLEQFA